MPTLSTDVLRGLVAEAGRYLQWEMPIPHGTLKDHHFTLRNTDGAEFLVLESGAPRNNSGSPAARNYRQG